jgi:hypothetical protein
MGRVHVLQIATVVEGVAVWPRLNLKSKLGLVGDVASGSYPLLLLGIVRRGGCDGCVVLSLFLAVSTACLSYLSQSFAVLAGVPGGGRGCLKGDVFPAGCPASFGVSIVTVEVVILRLCYLL